MELITAIALICQLNIGSRDYNIDSVIMKEQKTCQKELATCILKNKKIGVVQITTVLTCIKER